MIYNMGSIFKIRGETYILSIVNCNKIETCYTFINLFKGINIGNVLKLDSSTIKDIYFLSEEHIKELIYDQKFECIGRIDIRNLKCVQFVDLKPM